MDGISSIYGSQYLNSTASSSKVEDSLSKDYATASDDELMNVCKEFETYFVEQVFKEMKKMVPDDEDDSSGVSTLDYFEDTMTQEFASMVTEKGELGIAQTLYDQMKINYNL
ncbi:rod-binding protein [Konateibacter massiliensis]|uniref:rod-binding protein n=1 Tax=Konateibacter massiliensis TaxID=2002841 RepID=UPI000C1614F2|nr:rod-binding protein [Konateibacter massiliensis]